MTESKERIIEQAEETVLHTYNRYPVVLDRGEGVYLYDTEGKNIWILRPGSPCRPWATIIPGMTRH